MYALGFSRSQIGWNQKVMMLTQAYLTTNQSEECPQLILPSLNNYYKIPHYPLCVRAYSFEGISPLWVLLPGKETKIFLSTSPKLCHWDLFQCQGTKLDSASQPEIFKNNYTPWPSRVYFKDARLVQYLKINNGNSSNYLHKNPHMAWSMHKKYLTEFNIIYENNIHKINKKNLSEIWNGRNHPHSIKNIYQKKKIKITVNGEKTECLPLRSRISQECSLSLLLFSVVF